MFKGTIKELFDKFDSFKWDFCVFAEPKEMNLNTECICIDSDDEKVVGTGIYFKVDYEGKEYVEFLGIQDIDQIFFNLKTQISDPSDELKLKAVLYYYETDCFLEVNPEPKVS